MKSETKILGIVLLITLALITGGVIFLSRGQASPTQVDQSKVYQIDYSKGQKLGSDSAKVKLVEFSDFECPACVSWQPTVSQLLASDGAQIEFYYRNFPLPQHSLAIPAAEAAEAAGAQGKFWEMHDRLFATQPEWSTMSTTDATNYFVNLANQLGIDGNKIREAINNQTYKVTIDADVNDGMALNINATPTFFLNGHKLDLADYPDLKIAVDQAIQQAQPTSP